MNIIFLDIDGVLNCQTFYERNLAIKDAKNYKTALKKQVKKKEIERLEYYKSMIDSERLEWLNNLCTQTNCKVVISSTWRNIPDIADILKTIGANFDIVGITPTLPCRKRGCEIDSWWKEHGKDYNNYVIIDDDGDMLLWQAAHFFQTDNYSGLTPNICYKIKRYLNDEYH